MDWNECIRKKIAKEIKKDEALISSLLKTSENKIISSDKLELSEQTAESKISLAYDSLREILEVLSIKKGFKIYNHECYTSFLKEILNENEKAEEFDELRKIRNSINYYGKSIHIEEAEEVINRIKKLRDKILLIVKKEDTKG
jgi:hypothetical protein